MFLFAVVINCFASNPSNFTNTVVGWRLLISLWITTNRHTLTTALAERLDWAIPSTYPYNGTPLDPEMPPQTAMSTRPDEVETRCLSRSTKSGNVPNVTTKVTKIKHKHTCQQYEQGFGPSLSQTGATQHKVVVRSTTQHTAWYLFRLWMGHDQELGSSSGRTSHERKAVMLHSSQQSVYSKKKAWIYIKTLCPVVSNNCFK